jgi:membrane protease subunit (stomatin/prohibitin family)
MLTACSQSGGAVGSAAGKEMSAVVVKIVMVCCQSLTAEKEAQSERSENREHVGKQYQFVALVDLLKDCGCIEDRKRPGRGGWLYNEGMQMSSSDRRITEPAALTDKKVTRFPVN